MRRKRSTPKPSPVGRRDGWGRPINFDLPLTDDERLERVRGVLDRSTFVRLAVLEKLAREEQAA
jgi:hypothetical protein